MKSKHKCIIISKKAIEEILFETLIESSEEYFNENTTDGGLVVQMLFDSDSCKCVYVLSPLDQRLSNDELKRLITEDDTTVSLYESHGCKYKVLKSN